MPQLHVERVLVVEWSRYCLRIAPRCFFPGLSVLFAARCSSLTKGGPQ